MTMVDTSSETPETPVAPVATAKDKRDSKISERLYITEDGSEADSPLDSVGYRYTYLEEADKPYIEMVMEEQPKEVQCALFAFGGITWAGNIANRIRNGQLKEGGPQTVREALALAIENLKAGNWTSPRGEVEVGISLLAKALLRAKNKIDNGKLADGTARTLESVTTFLKGQTKDQKKAWREKVKGEILDIQKEALAEKGAQDATAALTAASF